MGSMGKGGGGQENSRARVAEAIGLDGMEAVGKIREELLAESWEQEPGIS